MLIVVMDTLVVAVAMGIVGVQVSRVRVSSHGNYVRSRRGVRQATNNRTILALWLWLVGVREQSLSAVVVNRVPGRSRHCCARSIWVSNCSALLHSDFIWFHLASQMRGVFRLLDGHANF